MKRMIFSFIILFISLIGIPSYAAMSTSEIRKNARFLTDKMVYELNLTPRQYNDIYEVNYDFLRTIRYTMDQISRGYINAYDEYYEALDIRNKDLRWILNRRQYSRFMQMEYFFRPIYMTDRKCYFRVYRIYPNQNHYYFDFPHGMRNYRGEHYHISHKNQSYYRNRYDHKFHNRPVSVRDQKVYSNNRDIDFGGKQHPNHSSDTNKSQRPTGPNKPGFSRPSQNTTQPNTTGKPNRGFGNVQNRTTSSHNQVGSGIERPKVSPGETTRSKHTGEKKNKSERK